MVFNRHLKALNLCNHSDTIACVLYELLVNLELIIVGFQTHVQGSTSFSFVQFSRSCCAVLTGCPAGQLVYNTTAASVCQHIFQIFLQIKKLYSYVTNKNRVGSQNRGSKNAPEKESKGTKMKYEIVGIEHAVGDFTPTSGQNANTVQHYDVYRLHTLKNSKDAYGQITAVVRATPDQMGQIIADLGGNIADVPGHILDMEVRNSFGKINLTDYEVVE